MAEKEDVVSIDTALGLVEELQKAFDELESHREDSLHNKAHWQDVKEHFRNLGRSLKEKSKGVEEKENAFQVKLSESRASLAEREASVAGKERGFLNRLQELKDAAVSAVSEARKNCKLEIPVVPVNIFGSQEKKVSTVANVDSLPQLKQICEEMDSKGLTKFILEYGKHHMSLRKELSIALKSVPQPARLVLEALEGFYPPSDQPITSRGNEKDIRRNFLVLIESIPDNNPVSSEIKQQAKATVEDWKPKLAALDLDASNGNSSEALAFFQIVTIFGVESGFDEDELCKLVLAVSRRRQAPELCRSLGLTHKMPGVTEALVSKGRPLDAVHFAYAFNLTESFPPLPLLKAFLNEIGITSHDTSIHQNDTSSEELTALRTIVKYIEDFKLQDEYPLAPLQKRVSQIKKEKNFGRAPEVGKFVSKKARVNSGYPPRGVDSWRPPARVFDERVIFSVGGGVSERYPYAAPPPASYGHQPSIQRAYHPPPPVSAQASYGSYMDTAAVNHGTYSSSGYQSAAAAAAAAAAAPSNYGNYAGAGFQPSH